MNSITVSVELPRLLHNGFTYDIDDESIIVADGDAKVTLAVTSESTAGDVLLCKYVMCPVGTTLVLGPMVGRGVEIFGVEADQ